MIMGQACGKPNASKRGPGFSLVTSAAEPRALRQEDAQLCACAWAAHLRVRAACCADAERCRADRLLAELCAWRDNALGEVTR